MNEDEAEKKAVLRRQLRAAAKNCPAEARALASAQMCVLLKEQAEWQRARSILLFLPLPDEPDLLALVPEALSAGKIVTFPRYSRSRDSYGAGRITNLSADLRPGAFGIREPAESCPAFALNRLDFVLVPGLGFSLGGWRLGRGKGYYDRLLAEVPGFKCGVGFDWQVTVDIPVEPHDIRLDCILTPTRWHRVVGPASV